MCELYLHEMSFPLDRYSNPSPHLGDVQLMDFFSFVSNHVQWENSFQIVSQNEANSDLWIQSEPHSPCLLPALHKQRLASPIETQQIIKLQEYIISTCVNQISRQQHLDLEGSKHRW